MDLFVLLFDVYSIAFKGWKTIVNLKTDKEVKENAQKLASELGLTLSAVINAYLKQFIRTREVYFSSIPKMTPALENLIGKVEQDYKKKKNISI